MKERASPLKDKIQYHEILRDCRSYAMMIQAYREKVLAQKTRTIRLVGRKSSARILHTLLGYEVQAFYKRIQCPDLVTARYLRLFSELGCHSIKLPYDPTLTEQLVPEFEASIEDLKRQIAELFPRDLSTRRYVIRRVYGIIRQQIAAD
jgi:hypothetical protein